VRRLLAVLALTLVGCAASDPGGQAPAQSAGDRPRRYQTTAMVLESRDHGPQLCLGAIASMLPPACEGLPIPNWRWDRVQGEETANGTTWGRYRLVGAYDGASFTVSGVALALPERPPSHEEQFTREPRPGCPEPAGGWAVPDPARRSERHLEPVTRAARAQPDFAGLWLSYLAPMGDNVAEDPGEFVLNVAFTGDLARHQAELRSRWGGRLCVTGQQRSYRRLLQIQRDLHGDAGRDLGLRVLGTGMDEYANAVSLTVVVLEERARQALEARYGPGAVEPTAVLTPVA
jgi:hypothetical protein